MQAQAHVVRVHPLRFGVTTLGILLLLLGNAWSPARAAGIIVVGDGTPESCTDAAFQQAAPSPSIVDRIRL